MESRTPNHHPITARLSVLAQEALAGPTDMGWTDLLVGTHYGLWGEDFCQQVWQRKGYPAGALKGLLASHRATAFTSTSYIWSILRRLILERDPKCARCGKPSRVVHHITQVGRGGHPLDPENLEGLCRLCHGSAHSFPRKSVHADSSPPEKIVNLVDLQSKDARVKHGHPLQNAGRIFKQWDALYEVLLPLVGSSQRAEMVREALRLQALTALAYPSAGNLAARAGACPKTWSRCLATLRARGWARTVRLHRWNGQESVNLVDLSRLWAVVRGLLQRMLATLGRITCWEKVRGAWWVKVGGVWSPLRQVLPLVHGENEAWGSEVGP